MTSQSTTPSVDFNFLDKYQTSRESPPPLQEEELLFDLSYTNHKKDIGIQETTATPQQHTHRPGGQRLDFNDIETEQFIHQYTQKSTPSHHGSDYSFGTAHSKSIKRQIIRQTNLKEESKGIINDSFNNISFNDRTSKENVTSLRLSLQDKLQNKIGGKKHPIFCFTKKRQIKMKLPTLKHAHSERITKNRVDRSMELPEINHPNTCKHIEPPFCVTQKGDERYSLGTKRGNDYAQRAKAVSSIRLYPFFKRSNVSCARSGYAVDAKNKSVVRQAECKQLKKSHIFLPSARMI